MSLLRASMIFLIAGLALSSASTSAVAAVARRECTLSESMRADDDTGSLRNWDAVYSWYRRWAQCDDGFIAEGNSEAIARILVDHWDALPRLEKLTRRDPALRRWVLENIDATLNVDDLRKLGRHARLDCPPHHSALCRDLSKAAAEAIKDE